MQQLFSVFDDYVSNYVFIGLPVFFMFAFALGYDVANEKLTLASEGNDQVGQR